MGSAAAKPYAKTVQPEQKMSNEANKESKLRYDPPPLHAKSTIELPSSNTQTRQKVLQNFEEDRRRKHLSATRSATTEKLTVTTKMPENTPYNPDLISCCQNIGISLAEACANASEFSRPSASQIYGFIRVLFAALQVEPECCVYADVYIRRLLSAENKVKAHYANWRELIVGACLLASKMMDDCSMQNRDFSVVLKNYTTRSLFKLESSFLHILNWRLFVPISEYTKRYFDLTRKNTQKHDWSIDKKMIKPHFSVSHLPNIPSV